MVKEMKQKLKDEVVKDGLKLSSQAISMLLKSDDPLGNTQKLVGIAKQKQMIIAGGDVLRFISHGKIPTSISTSEDMDTIEVRLNKIEALLSLLNKKVK